MSKIRFLAGILFTALFILSGCNLPSNAPTSEAPDAVQTNAALTVEALLNQPTPFNTPTLPSAPPTNTAFVPPTSAPPAATLQPLPSATPNCDLAQFVKDVSIPDGTNFNAGENFTKTWRLKNIGTCTWNGYAVVFDSGDAMSGVSPIAMGTVAPGQEVDVSVNLKAPTSSGSYRGYWRIRNASGVLIPVQGGSQQGKSFFVDIKVGGSAGFDLHSQAPSAQWISCGNPCGGGTTLTFPGLDTDPNGFVLYRNGATLEDGTSPTKVLETHPMWVNDGVITGLYPAYTVQTGEHFKAKIGFLGPCGAGNVVFQFNYKVGGTVSPLGSWTDSCDGTMISVDVNLNSLAGQSVQFVLGVLANGSSGQDWAVWVNPRVEIP